MNRNTSKGRKLGGTKPLVLGDTKPLVDLETNFLTEDLSALTEIFERWESDFLTGEPEDLDRRDGGGKVRIGEASSVNSLRRERGGNRNVDDIVETPSCNGISRSYSGTSPFLSSDPVPIPMNRSNCSPSEKRPSPSSSPPRPLFIPLEEQPYLEGNHFVLVPSGISYGRGIVFKKMREPRLYRAIRRGTGFVIEERDGTVHLRGVWANENVRGATQGEKKEARELGISIN